MLQNGWRTGVEFCHILFKETAAASLYRREFFLLREFFEIGNDEE